LQDSEGMLILSQDGRVARRIIGSKDIAKEYLVEVIHFLIDNIRTVLIDAVITRDQHYNDTDNTSKACLKH
jgi:16S rRNA U516 pseudouridylate synthase RsuA-like enzyme